MSIGLELRRRPAWGTPDSQDADRRSRFVDHEVHVIPRSRHEDAAKCWAARCRPPNAGVFNTRDVQEGPFELVGEELRRGWPMVGPPSFDLPCLLLRSLTESELHARPSTAR